MTDTTTAGFDALRPGTRGRAAALLAAFADAGTGTDGLFKVAAAVLERDTITPADVAGMIPERDAWLVTLTVQACGDPAFGAWWLGTLDALGWIPAEVAA